METTFHNVTITIPAIDSAEAYAILSSALARIGAEWTTDTFKTDASPDRERSTRELFPHVY